MKAHTRYARPYGRRLRFESLEQRQMLAVTLDLSAGIAMAPTLAANSPDYVNVSNQPNAYQSEMMLDVNPANPLHLAGFSHKLIFDAELAAVEIVG
jgi:Planctomycete extracellular